MKDSLPPVPDPDTAGPEGERGWVPPFDKGLDWQPQTPEGQPTGTGWRLAPSPPEASPDTGREALAAAVMAALDAEQRSDPGTYNVWLRVRRAVEAALSRSPERATAGEGRWVQIHVGHHWAEVCTDGCHIAAALHAPAADDAPPCTCLSADPTRGEECEAHPDDAPRPADDEHRELRRLSEAARAGRWYADGFDVLAAWSQPVPITTCDGSAVPEGNAANAAFIAAAVNHARAALSGEAETQWHLTKGTP